MLSKRREILLASAAGLCFVLLAGDRLIIGPVSDWWKSRGARLSELELRLHTGETLLGQQQHWEMRRDEMQGLVLPPAATDAERAVMSGITEWAEQSRFDLVSVRPRLQDGTASKRPVLEVRVSGTGTMSAVARFIHRIESASLALAVEDFEVTCPREVPTN